MKERIFIGLSFAAGVLLFVDLPVAIGLRYGFWFGFAIFFGVPTVLVTADTVKNGRFLWY